MDRDLRQQVLDTWDIHARIVRYVLDGIHPAALAAEDLKGRTVAKQFAHIHTVRLMWLEAAAPDLLEGLQKFASELVPDKGALGAALEASEGAMHELLSRGLDTGKIKRFKPHATAFLGYLVAHESYHQGDIGVRLTESGQPLDRKVAYGMWEWGTR